MVEARRLDHNLIDGLLRGEHLSVLRKHITRRSPLHPDDIDYFVGKIMEFLSELEIPEREFEAAGVLELVWALVSHYKLRTKTAKHLLIPLLFLVSNQQCRIATVNLVFQIIKLLLTAELASRICCDPFLTEVLKNIRETLVNTGDYATQKLIVEAMFCIAREDVCGDYVEHWFHKESVFTIFQEFGNASFDVVCRELLNSINLSSEVSKVFPVVAHSIIFGEIKVEKPHGSQLWVDFNYGSKCVSFYCANLSSKNQENSNARFETILIHANDVAESLLRVLPRYGLQELTIKLNCSCSSLINAPNSKHVKGSIVNFFFGQLVEIQTCAAEIFGDLHKDLKQKDAGSLDRTADCDKFGAVLPENSGTSVNHRPKSKASKVANPIHIENDFSNVEWHSTASSGNATEHNPIPGPVEQDDVNSLQSLRHSKASQAATSVFIGDINNVEEQSASSLNQSAEHEPNMERSDVIVNSQRSVLRCKASQVVASIQIGDPFEIAEEQPEMPLGHAAENNRHGCSWVEKSVCDQNSGRCSVQNKASCSAASIPIADFDYDAEVQIEKSLDIEGDFNRSSEQPKVSRSAVSIHTSDFSNGAEVQSDKSSDSATESNRHSPPAEKNSSEENSVKCSQQSKMSCSAASIPIDDFHDDDAARNFHFKNVKVNNVLVEKPSCENSGHVLSSPVSHNKELKNSASYVSESKNSEPSVSVSPRLKIFYFEKASNTVTSAVDMINGPGPEQNISLLSQSNTVKNKIICLDENLIEHVDTASMLTPPVSVKPSKPTKQLSESLELLEKAKISSLQRTVNKISDVNEKSSDINKTSDMFSESTEIPVEQTVNIPAELQKHVLLESSPTNVVEIENGNAGEKTSETPELQLQKDVLLEECIATNVISRKENTELGEKKSKRRKLFSNNSRANIELLKDTAVIEDDDDVAKHKEVYLEELFKEHVPKLQKTKGITLSQKKSLDILCDDSFGEAEMICTEMQKTASDMNSSREEPKKQKLEETYKKKSDAVISTELSPEMAYDEIHKSKIGIDDSGIGTATSADKSSSTGIQDFRKGKPQRQSRRKAAGKYNPEKKNLRNAGRKSRKAALDSMKKTQKMMQYAEENSSVDMGVIEPEGSDDFLPDKPYNKNNSHTSPEAYNRKSRLYSLPGLEVASSDAGSSKGHSHVSLFDSPVKSYKQWREIQKSKKKPDLRKKEKAKTPRKKKQSQDHFSRNKDITSLPNNNMASKVRKKESAYEFNLLADQDEDMSEIEKFSLVIERSRPKTKKIMLPKALQKSNEKLSSPFMPIEHTTKEQETFEDLDCKAFTSLRGWHKGFLPGVEREKNHSNFISRESSTRSLTSVMLGKHIEQRKNNINEITVEAEIEDPVEKLKLLRKKYNVKHKRADERRNLGSPYSDEINFIPIKNSRGTDINCASLSSSLRSTMKNSRTDMRSPGSANSSVVAERTAEDLEPHKHFVQSRGNDSSYLADDDLSDMDSGKKIHMDRYLTDVATCLPAERERHTLPRRTAQFDLNANCKRKLHEFDSEAQSSSSKLVKYSHPRAPETAPQSVATSQLGSAKFHTGLVGDAPASVRTAEKTGDDSKFRSIIHNILKKYEGKKVQSDRTLANLSDGDHDDKMIEQKIGSSISDNNTHFYTPSADILPTFQNENVVCKFQETISVRNATDVLVSPTTETPLLEKLFGEILKMSRKYVTSVQKYRSFFCEQVSAFQSNQLTAQQKSVDAFLKGTKSMSQAYQHSDENFDDPIEMSKQLRADLAENLKDLRQMIHAFQVAEENLETSIRCMQKKVALKCDANLQQILMNTQAELERQILNEVKKYLSKFQLNCC